MPVNNNPLLTTALSRYEIASDGWADVYRKAKEDLDFLSDKEHCQWDTFEANQRRIDKRPIVQISQLPQFIHQVTNDIRQNTPTIKVIPAGNDSDIETAEIIEGRIKSIEYKSNADAAYDMAADFAVRSGIGFLRLDHQYCEENPFQQEIVIKRVVNPSAYFIDPKSVQADGSDAEYGFVLEDMSVTTFKAKYPNAAAVSFGDKARTELGDDHEITVAEYFYFEDATKLVGLLQDGSVEDVKEGVQYVATKETKHKKLMRCWLSGDDVLEEPQPFPGKYIPIVPVYGEEEWIDGKRNLKSLIRNSKSAQRNYNLWKSAEEELLKKQPIAPVQAAVGQMRGFEEDWKAQEAASVLYYHQTDAEGQQAPAPQRLAPPQVPTGIVNAARESVEDIKATMGLYNTSLGAKSAETSGIAIQRREAQGDIATLHFGDNLVRSITQVGKIIVSMLPVIEDTPRIIQIVGREDETKMIGINGALVEGQERSFDFTRGQWDVRVVTGASFTTQRQEAAEMYNNLITKMPDLMPVIGDLVFKYQDSPGSLAISARLKKLVDPKLLDEKELDEGAQNPEVVAVQQEATQVIETAKAEIEQLQAKNMEAEKKAAAEEARRIQSETKAQIEKLKYEEQLAEARIEKLRATTVSEIESMQAQQQPVQTMPQGEDNMMMDEEALLAKLEQVRMQKAEREQALMQQQQAEQERMAMEAQKEAYERQKEEQEAMQRQMLIDGVAGVQQMLGQLVSAISKPKTVTYDANGMPTGVR